MPSSGRGATTRRAAEGGVIRFMGPMAKSEIEGMEWVVKHRSKVQELLLEIYKRSIRSGNSKKEAAILQLLVGVAYSLWRAVFLADTLRQPKDVSKNTILPEELFRVQQSVLNSINF